MDDNEGNSSEVRASPNNVADELKATAHQKISAQELIAELNAANAALSCQVTALTQLNRETVLFSSMNDFLQSSTNEAEAYSVISATAAQLFPDDSGGVFVLSASRDVLEAAVVWGATTPASLVFLPSECWAHRRGQGHLVLSHEQRCSHVANDEHSYVCLPLLAQGETLGVLHIRDGTAKADEANEARFTEKCRVAKILADNIGLGIANLKLRITLRDLSIRDPLTGLFNRRYMEEALAQEQHRAKRNDTKMAVIMIDIDHFKVFNDTYGHDAGDAILRELGAFLKKHVRRGDTACRYGGEEFILILSPSTAEGAAQRAEKIREDAALLSVKHADRDLGAITLSLGVAMFPGDASGTAEVIKAADVALFQAKRNGRNQVVQFMPVAERKIPQRSQ